MNDIGQILRTAREDAGLTLAGIASRTGFSRSYLGNVETGHRQPTVAVITAYEKVLKGHMNRRHLLLGSLAALATVSTDTTAVSIANSIRDGQPALLTETQTSHNTDREIARLLADDTASLTQLLHWTRRGKSLLRVNATGILAKTGAPVVDRDTITVLRDNPAVRQLYLTAVLARTLNLEWQVAGHLADQPDLTAEQADRVAQELHNPYDLGARWCAILLLHQHRHNDPQAVTNALLAALRTETSPEALRALGCALAGSDPLTL